MLRKLMKYDLKYYRKIMLPLWAVLIIYGIVHGINTVFNYEIFYDHIPIKAQAIVVLTILYMIIYGIIWTMHLIYQAYTAICIGQMRSKNRFATTIIVGAFLFLAGYEMQEILLRHNRYYSWFYLPCLIAFLVEIVLCHLVIEFILTRKLNIN